MFDNPHALHDNRGNTGVNRDNRQHDNRQTAATDDGYRAGLAGRA